MEVSLYNNYFLFLSPNSIFFLQWECDTSSLETGFLLNGDFMVSWCIGSREDLISSWKPFLGFLLSFFINYVVMSTFCLRDKSFNEDRNHHQCIVVLPSHTGAGPRNHERPKWLLTHGAQTEEQSSRHHRRIATRPWSRGASQWRRILSPIRN